MSSSKATAISPVTLDLLSDVNFDVSPATTVSGINETVIRQNSNSSNMADCNLLVDFDIADDVQQLATQVRRFHVLDEDFNLSSINFDFKRAKECNYKAGIFGCNGHENNEDMWSVTCFPTFFLQIVVLRLINKSISDRIQSYFFSFHLLFDVHNGNCLGIF